MIKIKFDPENLVIDSNLNQIESSSDFPVIVKRLIEAFHTNENFSLMVKSNNILNWFKNMAERFPRDAIIFEYIDPKTILSQQWGITIPKDVANEEILESELLSTDIHPQSRSSFEETILTHYLSPLMIQRHFPFSQITRLIQATEKKEWADNKKIALIDRVFQNQIEKWKQNAKSSEQLQLIDLFESDPTALKKRLMNYNVLHSYPEIGENLLGKWFGILKALNLRFYDLEIDESSIQDAVMQVTYFLNSQQIISSEMLEDLIENVSGLLVIEFEKIEELLRNHQDWITEELLERLQKRFEGLSSKVDYRIKTLQRLIRPPKPTKPEMEWDEDRMLNWVIKEYLPYQTWCLENEAFEQATYQFGDIFSEWLLAHWKYLLPNSNRMVFNFFPNIAVQITNSRYINLIIVVDNLGWSYTAPLVDIFKNYKYYPILNEPYFAMVPTETEISKKCLLSGENGYSNIDDKQYKGLLENGWVPYFGENTFKYISNISKLEKINKIEASAYVVNYLEVDKVLHKSSDEIGMSHREHIDHFLSILVQRIDEFIKKHDLMEKIRIHIISDHGSTRIPEEDIIPNELDIKTFKADGFEICSHRHVRVSEEKFHELADNLKLDCFFLSKNDFNNDSSYLCARRSNRFLATNRDMFVHGGLLPEEIIVPHLIFEGASLQVLDPTIILISNQFRFRKETIQLEIGNPNERTIENIRISILNNNISSNPKKIIEIKANTNKKIEIEAKFRRTPQIEEQKVLHLRIRFLCRGENNIKDCYLKIEMRKMVEQEDTDLFDV